MEYMKKEQGSYQLHVIKTKAFKTITVKVFFREIAEKENITMRNFLSSILLLSTKDYPTKSSLTKALQNLYAANIRYSSRRLGAYLDTSFSLKVLHDRYTEQGNLEKAITLLESVIFHPNIEQNGFNERDFNAIYEEYKADLDSIKDDRSSYALMRLVEQTNPTSKSTYRSMGYIEDLEKITPESLYAYYQNMLQHNFIDIYVIGDVDMEEIAPIFRDHFPVHTFKANKVPVILPEVEHGKSKTKRELIKATQTQLCLSLSTNHLTEYERNYPLSIYNTILGGGTESLLFKEVREKNSLAYHISSSTCKFDHLILINGGIANGTEEATLKIIKKQLKRLAKGDFTQEDLEAAKEFYLTALDDIVESPYQIIDAYYMMDLLGVDDIKTKQEKMKQVTKEEVIAVANKIKINTVFVLEGVTDEENNN